MPEGCPNCLMPPPPPSAMTVRVRMDQDLNLRDLKKKCEHTVPLVYAEFLIHSGAAQGSKWTKQQRDLVDDSRFHHLEELDAFRQFRIWKQEIEGAIFTDEED